MARFRLLIAAAAAAALIATTTAGAPFGERLVRAEAQQAVPEAVPLLRDAPPAISAVLLEYADKPALRLAAQHALRRHPRMARRILPLYAEQPAFQRVLSRYAGAALPAIQYFLEHEMPLITAVQRGERALAEAGRVATDWWQGEATPPRRPVSRPTPVERGWYAVQVIDEQGHDFLGQFTVAGDGRVARLQSERVIEATGRFLAGGVRALEGRLRRGETPDASDYLWAGLDLAVVVGVTKLIRAGRTAAGTARAASGGRLATATALTGRTLARGTHTALRLGKYAAPVALVYAVIRHPGLVSSLADRAATMLGLPGWLGRFTVWSLLLLPLLALGRMVWRRLARPVFRLLLATARMLRPRPAARATG